MDFTELYKQTSNLCIFSPNGLYIAIAVQHRLVIRDAESLQIVQLFSCIDNIQAIEWSKDSEYILCASYKLGVIQVWSLSDQEWTAKINEGVVGLTRVQWAPDGRHIISFSDFKIRISIWSLITKEVIYIQYPKFNSTKGFKFRKDGNYLAVAGRKDCKDFINIYECNEWSLLKHFVIEDSDLQEILWSPDGKYLAVINNSLEYNVYIYYPDGRLIKKYTNNKIGLGVKSANWSPSAQILAVGDYEQNVTLLNNYTWDPLIKFSHDTIIEDSTIVNEMINPPVELATVPIELNKPNPKIGISMCLFNSTGIFLLTKNDNMPNYLWIWNIATLKLVTIIEQLLPIKQVSWNPVIPGRLAFITGNSNIYFWDAEMGYCECVDVPALNFEVHSIKWNPNGKSIVLMDKDKFCLAFPIEDELEDAENMEEE
ncbi:YVTN repeat-like/Quino protein amine dehydrogenase [Piromyces finnis]|uniref:YVTN repeat-like/Quino protein amine dehydrogenase n=1 Tax=Piromyces finnis TaxID=1754191 RepID=A0A1Y1V6M5_9FUNG|nr:YVTN repeat-like/Quino protein amine dehydrogenase [Piromyces finnis]|eukprot:ORX48102.1 YVTN repeat-like/Quino protein amine dehydrogenase [Piromyces finnis]